MIFVNQRRIALEIKAIVNGLKDAGGINILLQGPSGCGKTLLAKIICSNLGDYNLSMPSKIGSINLNKVENFRVNFIDEIHLYKDWESLYYLMDRGDKIFVFCTTEYDDIPEPFLTRCVRFSFDPYDVLDLTEIVRNYAKKRRFLLDNDSYFTIANTSRGNPRIAKQRFDRIKLLLEHYNKPRVGVFVNEMLDLMGIMREGYTSEDLRYLEYLSKVPSSSLDNLCRTLQLNKLTVQREIEPYLLEKENVQITSKGRIFKKWPKNYTIIKQI
jgi:Holliday junction resolvasome RuvABC ATP-dependent DNA helicase subunit